MSTRKVISSIFVLCLFGIFVSNVLSASPETMLIGKWKYFKGEKIEFVKDGTLIIGNQGAKYRIIDRERIEFDLGMLGIFSDLGPRPVFRFTVSNDELTLIPLAEPNKAQKLRRVKVDASGNDAETYFTRGYNNFQQRDYQQAIKDYDKAIELDPKYAAAYNNRGISYGLLGNHKQAIKDFDKAIELDPKAAHFRGRAIPYLLLGNYQQTIKDCDKAIELDPKDSIAYAVRGDAYFKLGNYQQAIKGYERAIEFNPKLVSPYYNVASIYSIQNNAAPLFLNSCLEGWIELHYMVW